MHEGFGRSGLVHPVKSRVGPDTAKAEACHAMASFGEYGAFSDHRDHRDCPRRNTPCRCRWSFGKPVSRAKVPRDRGSMAKKQAERLTMRRFGNFSPAQLVRGGTVHQRRRRHGGSSRQSSVAYCQDIEMSDDRAPVALKPVFTRCGRRRPEVREAGIPAAPAPARPETFSGRSSGRCPGSEPRPFLRRNRRSDT